MLQHTFEEGLKFIPGAGGPMVWQPELHKNAAGRGVAHRREEHCVGRCSFIFKLAQLCPCGRWLSPEVSFGKGTLKYSEVSGKG